MAVRSTVTKENRLEAGVWGLGACSHGPAKAGHYVRSWGLKAGRSQLEAGALELFQPQVPSLYTFF
jgi:hypothetical protein